MIFKTIFAVFLCATVCVAAQNVDVKSFGAAGDGKTLDTDAIQKAIDLCSQNGGGTVTIPDGTFVIGTILIKDNVTLHLSDHAELLGTGDLSKYQNVDPFKDGLGAEVGFAMVAAVDAKNVTIDGKGEINGNRDAVVAAKSFKGQGWGFRPFLVRIVRCNKATIRDVKLLDSASWTTNLAQSQDVNLERVTIHSRGAPHNDGIDIDSCQAVTVRDCDIVSGDDGICLKSTGSGVCKDFSATGCKISSNQGAIKLGTESYGGFENVRINNCQIYDTKHGGIKVLGVDGGDIKNVTISDIEMTNVSIPIFIRLGARLKTFREGDKQKLPGVMQNVVIRNVKAKVADKSQLTPPMGMLITGIPDHPIENLTIENVQIDLPGGGTTDDAHAKVQENIDTYPEVERFGKVIPAYGMYIRHAKDVKIDNVTLGVAKPDLRAAIVCDDVEKAELSNWNIPSNAQAECLVRLQSSRQALLSQFAANGPTGTFLRIEGKDSTDIHLSGENKLSAAKMFETADGAADSAISQ